MRHDNADIVSLLMQTIAGGGGSVVSPTIDVVDIPGGHRLIITDEQGTENVDIMNGHDGISPEIEVETITGGHQITITTAEETEIFTVLDGTNGADGADGVSPQCSITQITGGHRLVISDAGGLHMTDIMDGEDGDDYVLTNQDKQDIADIVVQEIGSADTTSY